MSLGRRFRSVTALLLALAGPTLVLAESSRWFGSRVEAPPLSPVAVAMTRRLAASPPGILVLGSSKAVTDIDPTVIAAALDYQRPVLPVEVLPASSAPAWYAFLRERVYGAGYTPELVVIHGTLAGMLDVQPSAWWTRERGSKKG